MPEVDHHLGRPDEGRTSNLLNHLRSTHKWCLAPEHAKASKSEVAEAAAAAAADGAPPGGFTREVILRERASFLHLCAMGGLPLAFTDNPGWAVYAREHNIPVIPRTTLRDTMAQQMDELVHKPITPSRSPAAPSTSPSAACPSS